MKIAVDLTPIRPDGSAGGVMGLAIELSKALIQQQDIKLIFLCEDWNKNYLSELFKDKVEYKLVNGKKNTRYSRLFTKVMHKLGLEVLKKDTLQGYEADLLFCPFSAVNYKQEGIPVVSTINDIQHEFYPHFFTHEELQHRKNFYKKIVENADYIICISEYTKKTFCENYGYDLNRVSTVYIGIQERFCSEDKSILDKLEVEKDKYIVYPANFWEHKNHKLLLNAFGMYAVCHQEEKLVLTGNILGQEEYYNQIINAMRLNGRVKIAGYLSEEELYAVMNNAKGLIYPSLFEGFGIPIIEAMQMNNLIASSNLTSLPEIGCDSVFYFNPKKLDEIVSGIEFLFHSKTTEDIEKDYKQQLQKFTTEIMVKEYLKVFRKAVERGSNYKQCIRTEGVYGDGWSQSIINFSAIKHRGDVLHVQFRVPEHFKGKILIKAEKETKTYRYEYSYDKLNDFAEILRDDNQNIQIKLSETWKPEDVMHNGDNRELGIMIENMEIITREKTEKINVI